MYLPSVAIKRVEDARQKDMHALAGWCTRRGEWPINGRRARGSASCGTRPCRSPPPRRGISSSNGTGHQRLLRGVRPGGGKDSDLAFQLKDINLK
jgi:hypothetical protein